jgi:hypothetical protein
MAKIPHDVGSQTCGQSLPDCAADGLLVSVILEGLLWHRDVGAYTVYFDLSLPETRRPNICLHSGSGLDSKL